MLEAPERNWLWGAQRSFPHRSIVTSQYPTEYCSCEETGLILSWHILDQFIFSRRSFERSNISGKCFRYLLIDRGFMCRYMTWLLHEGIFHVEGVLKPAIFRGLPRAYVMCNWAQILICWRRWLTEKTGHRNWPFMVLGEIYGCSDLGHKFGHKFSISSHETGGSRHDLGSL